MNLFQNHVNTIINITVIEIGYVPSFQGITFEKPEETHVQKLFFLENIKKVLF